MYTSDLKCRHCSDDKFDKGGNFDSLPLYRAAHKIRSYRAHDSPNKRWTDLTTSPLVPHCERFAGSLTGLPRAIYMYLCVRWSLFAECDHQQAQWAENDGRLDDSGLLRRARFLSGSCPMSPATLLNRLGMFSDARKLKCSKLTRYTGDSASQLYQAEVDKTVCLLGDYMLDNGNLNSEHLIKQADARVRKVVHHCVDYRLGTSYLSAEKFVRCWAGFGVFDCAKTEAQRVAKKSVPESCSYEVPVSG